MDRIRVEVGSDFVPLIQMEAPNLITEIASLRGSLESDEGFALPAVRLRDSAALSPLEYRILMHEEEVGSGVAEAVQSATSTMVGALKDAALQHREELTA